MSSEEAKIAPPELIFVHGGHTETISDFSWHPDEPWLMCSVSENNYVQVWKMVDHIYSEDE